MSAWTLEDVANMTESEVRGNWLYQELSGDAKGRGAQGIQMLLVYYFGKNGIMFVLVLSVLGFTYHMIKEIREFKRYIKKDRLFRMGLVNDLYDDYKPKSLREHIILLFRKEKDKIIRKKYPSRKKMLENLNKDKLYRKMYGDSPINSKRNKSR